MRKLSFAYALLAGLLLGNKLLFSQISLPPSGDNEKSVVTQYMGLSNVTITYNSPNVHAPNGTDRTGHIWGELVPYGYANLGFGYSSDEHPSPWRAGANENTTIEFSHDVTVEGKKLKAGKYGFFVAPAEGTKPWTLIFSNNSTSWGSFYYRPEEDALRVDVMPAKSEYHEWVTYDFTDRGPDSCTAELMWENIRLPFTIKVNNMTDLYISRLREELRNSPGFDYNSWIQAANYCVQNKTNLNEALTWATFASDPSNGTGRKDFNSLSCKANVLNALGRNLESDSIMKTAVNEPSASALDIHFYARGLQQQGRNKEALEIFKINYQKHPDDVVTSLGLARGYSANADYKNALKYAKAALAMDPQGTMKQTLTDAVTKLEAGKDFN